MPIVDDRCCATLPSVEVMCLDVAVVTHDVMTYASWFCIVAFFDSNLYAAAPPTESDRRSDVTRLCLIFVDCTLFHAPSCHLTSIKLPRTY